MDLNLSNKRVLVSGSSRGIGLAIVDGFLREGARVAITSRKMVELERIESGFASRYSSGRIYARDCDFTDLVQVEGLREDLIATWDGIDIVVANVGSGRSVSDPVPTQTNFNEVMNLNFEAAVNTARVFLSDLEVTQGNLLFIASIAGLEALGAPTDYSVAKAAVVALSKNVSRKTAGKGVRVNCIAPGNIMFEGGTWASKMRDTPETTSEYISSSVPMKRFGRPEEIADAALFLCSDRASFATGALLCIDGGQTTGY